MNIDEILKITRQSLGEDADLSYITEEALEKAAKAEKVIEVSDPKQMYDGNSLTQYADGHWEWWLACDTKTRYKTVRKVSSTRKVNCANGLIRYDINVL